MPVDSRHPDYLAREDEWALMRHTARGANAVKAEGSTYLPMPNGFTSQPDSGEAMYQAYMTRAQVPEIVTPTVSGMVGVIHRTETQIELPDSMLGLHEKATKDGLTLQALHQMITAEVLTTGRYALLADAAPEGSDLPWIASYRAESVINWSEDRDFYVLDETKLVRTEFEWAEERRYRQLELVDGKYEAKTWIEGTADKDGSTTFVTEDNPVQPRARGDKALDEIPLVIIGPRDLSVPPADPPLIGVARSCISQYQLSADYRWQLFMSGQETLVIINGDAPNAVGAGVCIALKGEPQLTPDAKYVGPAGTGIDAHKVAIEDEKKAGVAAGAKLFEDDRTAEESGKSRRIRMAAQTATLVSIAQASAQGLEKALRYVGMMMGLDDAAVQAIVVKPNLSFIDATLTGAEALNLVKAWQAGGMSFETLYENLQRGEIASAERTAEEEKALIDAEAPEPEADPEAAFV